ncbi:uncharacterized protein LOC129002735 [Macrosteles quadrilineatus]|uniref:uncharacterized protein LOC129002735 n=1 Tax=Macrosteles quadrilineatus TaxID=74068 RepID=UPI0023E0DA58|nr:uncharacterized protein LOC129002735 [Macrosteles quadrilineatus]
MNEFLLFSLVFFCVVQCKTLLIEAINLSNYPDDFEAAFLTGLMGVKDQLNLWDRMSEPRSQSKFTSDLETKCKYKTYLIVTGSRDQEGEHIISLYVEYRLLAKFTTSKFSASKFVLYNVTAESCDRVVVKYITSKTNCVAWVIEKRDIFTTQAVQIRGDRNSYIRDWVWEITSAENCDVKDANEFTRFDP